MHWLGDLGKSKKVELHSRLDVIRKWGNSMTVSVYL